VKYARGNWTEQNYRLTSFDLQLTGFGTVLLPRLRRDLSMNPATCFPIVSNTVSKHIATGAAGTRQIVRAELRAMLSTTLASRWFAHTIARPGSAPII
jgi:hypothetical protein